MRRMVQEFAGGRIEKAEQRALIYMIAAEAAEVVHGVLGEDPFNWEQEDDPAVRAEAQRWTRRAIRWNRLQTLLAPVDLVVGSLSLFDLHDNLDRRAEAVWSLTVEIIADDKDMGGEDDEDMDAEPDPWKVPPEHPGKRVTIDVTGSGDNAS